MCICACGCVHVSMKVSSCVLFWMGNVGVLSLCTVAAIPTPAVVVCLFCGHDVVHEPMSGLWRC